MRIRTVWICVILGLFLCSLLRGQHSGSGSTSKSPLQLKVEHFDLTNGILRDGISELSLKSIDGLHLGFEEIIRDYIGQDPRSLHPRFDVHLQGKTVTEILDGLCKMDSRYAWSQDGASINVYPRATVGDPSYLLNLRIENLTIKDVPDPYQALTPLSKLFPQQQIGYAGSGGYPGYAEPWTMNFEQMTVRQFINRIVEHVGSRTSWTWQGGQNERMFTFVEGGFNTVRPVQRKAD